MRGAARTPHRWRANWGWAPSGWPRGWGSLPGYAVAKVRAEHGASLRVTGTLRTGGQAGELTRADLARGQADGGLILSLTLPAAPAVLRVQGTALSPGIKDGQFMVLQAAPDPVQLEPEDTLLITLTDGRVLLRELMVVREHSLLVLPVAGGRAEPLAREDIAGIELLVCVVPRRWWRAGV